MSRVTLLWLAVLTVGAAPVFAGTIVAERIASANRLVPLEKITVGPDDQYRGSVDPAGDTLIFTRKSDLVPHLCRQDLRTGEVTDWLPLSADSQEASFSPDGLVAFTYYKFSAHGDICYRKLKGKADDPITCLKTDDGERSSPFWKSADELGYVVRDVRTLTSRIEVQNILTGKVATLVEGKVWSPAMKVGGRYLLYNELVGPEKATNQTELGQGRVMVLKDLQSGTTRVLRFELPGISGFPAVSDDERYVFFSHYLNDTNNDNIIDGNDNSVIFRAPIESLLTHERIFPEQLTSAESNCSFPRPYRNQLFITCAFEGALDIYRIPATGIVPPTWNNALLNNAHQTARTYQERVLLLNTMKYRMPAVADDAFGERLLTDHILSDDTSAAKYYVRIQQASAPTKRQAFYELLRLYLDALEQKKAQPSDEVSRAFHDDVLAIDAQMARIHQPPRLQKILRGLLRTFLNQPTESLAFLKQVRFDSPARTLERYYYFDLASWTLLHGKTRAGMTDIFRQMMTARELSEESHIYYAFCFLKYLQSVTPSLEERMAAIEKTSRDLPAPVATLLLSEVATLRIISAPDDKTKIAAYPQLDKLMSGSRSDYFLRKALYVRAILNFAQSAEFQYLSFVAMNWLRFTDRKDTEFAYARAVFVDANLDQAYDNFWKKKFHLASDYFYGSLNLTDDLESHYGYIRAMVADHQRAVLDTRYQNLKARQVVDDSMKFVEAMLRLVDAEAASPRSQPDGSALDFAIDKLEAMDQDRDSAVRYLLLGYCHLQKLFQQANSYDFNHGYFDDAHRELMLAYDIGRDNDRVKAAALMNLGLLHQRVQNHGLAVKFFSKREAIGFASDEEAARFRWFYARSLFYLDQPDKAADELVKAKALPPTYEVAFREREAFYRQVAGQFAQSAQAYREILGNRRLSGDTNLAKAYLAFGYSLFKLKKIPEAKAALRESLDHASRVGPIAHGGDRLVDFNPLRIQLAAYGLLGQIGSDTERKDSLEKRGQLLPRAKGLFDDELALELQNRLQLAALQSRRDPAAAAITMREALGLAEKLGDSGQYLSHAVFQAVVDYLVHASVHPQLYRAEDPARIRKMVEMTDRAYESQKQAAASLVYQRAKLKVLWAAYNTKVLRAGSADAEEVRRAIASSEDHSEELQRLADALK